MESLDLWSLSLYPDLKDLIIIVFYFFLIFLFAFHIKNKKITEEPAYKFFVWGLFAKIFGAIALGLIYTLYYKEGGDTTGYYRSSEALVNLLYYDPLAYFKILLGDQSHEAYSAFFGKTGYPAFWGKSTSFAVVRVASITTFLGFKNYFTSTILFATFFYIGYWKLFLLCSRLYPKFINAFAFSILFFPSVVFWGSGVSKDAIALSMTGLFVYSVFMVFIAKKNRLKNSLFLIISIYLVLSVKAYIFVAIVPGVFLFLAWNRLKRISNSVFRVIAAPLLVGIFLLLGFGVLSIFRGALGEYGDIDGIISKAILTYEDHSRAVQYGENYYSLGTFDGTRWNFFSKAPQAILAGVFRPFLWESRNPVMFIAGLENTAFILMVLVIIWRIGLIKMIKISFEEPLVIFSLSFAIIFGFAVGIATANFGALVRLKIPLIPFLGIGLFILFYRAREIKFGKEKNEGTSMVIAK